MFVYEKTILRVYRQLDGFIKSSKASCERKALASFRSRNSVEKIAEDIINMQMEKRELEELKFFIEESLGRIKPAYKEVLKLQYGLSEDSQENEVEKTRAFYRKVVLALGKFSAQMKECGYSKDVYDELIERFCFIKHEYERATFLQNKIMESKQWKCEGKTFKGNRKLPSKD